MPSRLLLPVRLYCFLTLTLPTTIAPPEPPRQRARTHRHSACRAQLESSSRVERATRVQVASTRVRPTLHRATIAAAGDIRLEVRSQHRRVQVGHPK